MIPIPAWVPILHSSPTLDLSKWNQKISFIDSKNIKNENSFLLKHSLCMSNNRSKQCSNLTVNLYGPIYYTISTDNAAAISQTETTTTTAVTTTKRRHQLLLASIAELNAHRPPTIPIFVVIDTLKMTYYDLRNTCRLILFQKRNG